MSELEIMKKQLEDTGLYDVRDGSTVLAELSAYAVGLDICSDALEELERECFVSTAEGEGLLIRQQLLGRPITAAGLAEKRSAIINGLSIGTGDYDLSGMQKVTDSFNLHGTLSYDSVNCKTVFVCSDELTSEEAEVLEKRLGDYMPFWCGFELVAAS